MKFKLNEEAILGEALGTFGIDAQVIKTAEECAELIQVLMKYQNHNPTLEKAQIVDEIADVIIMCEQMAQYFGIDLVRERIEFKMNRLNLVLFDETVFEYVMDDET